MTATTKRAGSTLDAILDSTAGTLPDADTCAKINAQARHARDASVDTSTMVPGELDATTLDALADFYDAKRDAALEMMAGVLGGYGAESDKRKGRMTAAIATPFMLECRRLLTAADAAQARAAAHRDAAGRAK